MGIIWAKSFSLTTDHVPVEMGSSQHVVKTRMIFIVKGNSDQKHPSPVFLWLTGDVANS